MNPNPCSSRIPPIWIGGHTGPALRRAAQLGDGWIPLGTFPPAVFEPAELQTKITRLRELTRQAGRPANAVKVGFGALLSFDPTPGAARRPFQGHPEQIAADLRAYQAVGVQDFPLFFWAPSVAEQLQRMERFAREVMPLAASA